MEFSYLLELYQFTDCLPVCCLLRGLKNWNQNIYYRVPDSNKVSTSTRSPYAPERTLPIFSTDRARCSISWCKRRDGRGGALVRSPRQCEVPERRMRTEVPVVYILFDTPQHVLQVLLLLGLWTQQKAAKLHKDKRIRWQATYPPSCFLPRMLRESHIHCSGANHANNPLPLHSHWITEVNFVRNSAKLVDLNILFM